MAANSSDTLQGVAMPWFQVDDGLSAHPKVTRIKRGVTRERAMGLWLLAGSWSAKYLTEGHIPPEQILDLGCTKQAAQWLVENGLWHSEGHGCAACPPPRSCGGYVFHEWTQANQSKDAVLAKRSARSEAGRIGGKASGQARSRLRAVGE